METISKINADLKLASGNVHSESKLVSFLYELMRDKLNPGAVQSILASVLAEEEDRHYCNGFLAQYAIYIANKLTETSSKK